MIINARRERDLDEAQRRQDEGRDPPPPTGQKTLGLGFIASDEVKSLNQWLELRTQFVIIFYFILIFGCSASI